ESVRWPSERDRSACRTPCQTGCALRPLPTISRGGALIPGIIAASPRCRIRPGKRAAWGRATHGTNIAARDERAPGVRRQEVLMIGSIRNASMHRALLFVGLATLAACTVPSTGEPLAATSEELTLTTLPTTIQAVDMSTKTAGGRAGAEWNIWSNGY